MSKEQALLQDNLIPIYFIEDKLQANFKKINNFMAETHTKNSFVAAELNKLKHQQNAIRENFSERMKEMEKKIVYQISMELEGRIAIAIGKSIDSFTEKIEAKEKNMSNMRDQFIGKIAALKQELRYQVTMENHKNIVKQTKKFEQIVKKASHNSSKAPQSQLPNIASSVQEGSPDWQQQHHKIQSLQQRINSLQQFSVNVDKRVYNGMTSLKESWKELGTQLLQNKKNMTKKFDQLKIQFLKLKGLKEFSILPDKIQDQFKRKLNQKFTDIYQLLSITLTKNQHEASTQKLSNKINRHDDQFIQIRNQLATNNQFFTFYANNADQQDLKKQIIQIVDKIEKQKVQVQGNIKEAKQKNQRNNKQISSLENNIKKMQIDFLEKVKLIDEMNQFVASIKDRIEDLQDFNKFGPDKLERIHNSLQVDFTATERQLIDTKNKKNHMSNVQQSQRQMRIQLSKLKDQLFLVSSQNQLKQDELSQLKKNYKQLQTKIQKVKGQNEQAMASRKPWVCLSCDRQQKQQQNLKKQAKLKRPQPFKGFHQQKSEKNLKNPVPNTPPFEQRFQVYQKLREKYLSDTIKLPEILKEKLRDKDTSLQG